MSEAASAPSDSFPLAFSFKDVSISHIHSSGSSHALLSPVSGYIRYGGLTAVLGVQSSGKSLLLKTLAGRTNEFPQLKVTGSLAVHALDGRVELESAADATESVGAGLVSFVPVEDLLIGDFTVRQTLRYAARLRVPDEPEAEREARIQQIMDSLGLGRVADSLVGTVLRRGLSGGEKRRCSVAVEMAAKPKILALNQPTLGLDAFSAWETLKAIKATIRSSVESNTGGTIGAIVEIHGPNQRLLDLFDDLLLLTPSGECAYFGPMKDVIPHFSSLGFNLPANTTATDYYLYLINQHKQQKALESGSDESSPLPCASGDTCNFAGRYAQSNVATTVKQRIQAAADRKSDAAQADSSSHVVAHARTNLSLWFHLYWVLFHRFLALGSKDVTLYYLQFVLNTGFAFLVGVMFFQLPRWVDDRFGDLQSGVTWLMFVGSYMQVFKVFYLIEMKKRLLHEYSNCPPQYRQYGIFPLAWAIADLTSILLFNFVFFLPGLIMGYFMMDMPGEAAGWAILVLFFATLAAESLCDLMSQFASTSPSAMILGQGVLVILCVFVDSSFIDNRDVKPWWIWLQKLSFFWWSTKSLNSRIFESIEYQCPANSFLSGSGSCRFASYLMPCSRDGLGAVRTTVSGGCFVNGPDVLSARSGYGADSSTQSEAVGVLLALAIGARILTFLMQYQQPLYIQFVHSLTRAVKHAVHSIFKPSHSHAKAASSGSAVNGSAQTVAVTVVQSKEKADAPAPVVAEANGDDDDDDLPKAASEEPASPIPLREAAAKQSGSPNPAVSTHPKNGMYLVWSDIQLTLKGSKKVLVSGINGFAPAGAMVAIMGPSGAGKTTFLNALSVRAPYARIFGQVELVLKQENGTTLHRPMIKEDLVYIPQFDNLNPAFTVFETLCQAFYLNNRLKARSCAEKVEEIVNILDLKSRLTNLVGDLSTGERKRLSCGVGLIASPSILILDEPTSALDSVASEVLMRYLQRVVRETGVICLLTIHQPSAEAFGLTDYLLLLSQGETVYFGPRTEAEQYFARPEMEFLPQQPANVNPADYYLDLISKTPQQLEKEEKARNDDKNGSEVEIKVDNESEKGQVQPQRKKWREYWEEFQQPQEAILNRFKELFEALKTPSAAPQSSADTDANQVEMTSLTAAEDGDAKPSPNSKAKTVIPFPTSVNEWSRFFLLVRSFFRYHFVERSIYWFRLGELVVIAFFVGSLFLRLSLELGAVSNFSGAMFFGVWSTLFSTVIAVPIYVRDRTVQEDQYLNGFYRSGTLHFAQFLASLPYNFGIALISQLIMWFMVGFHDSANAYFLAVFMTTALMALMEAIALIIVQIFQNAMLSTSFCMVVLGCFFLFPGFFVLQANMVQSIRWTPWWIPTKYALEGFLWNIFDGQSYAMPAAAGGGSVSGATILSQLFHVETGIENEWAYFAVVFGFVLAFRFAHWGLFHWQYSKYKIETEKKE